MTDPIADYLTRIRNAQMAKNSSTTIPYSTAKEQLARVMKKNDFIADYSVDESGKFKQLVITLKEDKTIALTRVSRPGQRIYVSADQIRKVKNGFGIAIVSTSKGVMTGYEARSLNVGGELICEIS